MSHTEKQGWGKVKSTGLFKFWKKRWISVAGKELHCYTKQEGSELKLSIPLDGGIVQDPKAASNTLDIRTRDGKDHRLKFSSTADKKEWLEVLRQITSAAEHNAVSSPAVPTSIATYTPAAVATRPPNSSKTQKAIESFFAAYRDADSEEIGPDGVARLCTDMNVEPDDIAMLIFAWLTNAATMGSFTHDEFVAGLAALGTPTTPAELKERLVAMKKDVMHNNAKLAELYRFAFQFCKAGEDPGKKGVDVEMAAAMLSVVLGEKYTKHTEKFTEFLRQQRTYKVLNSDQWACFLEFARDINEDLANYDDTAAWPSILDEYVEWRKENDN